MMLRRLFFLLPLLFCSNLPAAGVSAFPTFGVSYMAPKEAVSYFGLPQYVIGRYVFDKTSAYAGTEFVVELDPAMAGKTLEQIAATTAGARPAFVGGEKALKVISTTVKTPVQRNITYEAIHQNRLYRFTSTSPDTIDASKPLEELVAGAKFFPVESADAHVNEFSKGSVTVYGLCSFSGPRFMRLEPPQAGLVSLGVTDFTKSVSPFDVTVIRNPPGVPQSFSEIPDRLSRTIPRTLGLNEPIVWDDRADLPALHVSRALKRALHDKDNGDGIGYVRYGVLELGNGRSLMFVFTGVVKPQALSDYLAATDKIVASIKTSPGQTAAVDPNAR